MLQPVLSKLNCQRIVLASGSPRREQILKNIGLHFETIPSTFEENLDKSKFQYSSDYVKEMAKQKALRVARMLSNASNMANLIIGADTVVTMEGRIYEKPKDRDDAFRMLSNFSGKHHTVYSGIVLLTPKSGVSDQMVEAIGDSNHQFNMSQFHEATDVYVTEMTPDIINAYIDTGEPMDKAGGYGIQAVGGSLISGIHGDYFNVMGIPLHKFCQELLSFCQKHNLL